MSDAIVVEYSGDSDKHRPKEKKLKRITDSTMTQYEYAKLLSVRARQLQLGMEPKVSVDSNVPYNPIEIAKQEISERVIPLVIVRKIPDYKNKNNFREEIWTIKELNIRD